MSDSKRVDHNKPIVLKLGKVPNLRSATKRKSIENSPICGLKKKLKMDEAAIQKIISATVLLNNEQYQTMLTENKNELLTAISNQLEPMSKEMSNLSEKYESISATVTENSKDIASLQSSVSDMKKEVKAELLEELGQSHANTNLSAYKYTLSVENEKSAKNIIIHGMKSENPKLDVENLFAKLSIPPTSEYKITSVTKMGREGGDKIPSILVSLENQFQRNEILRHASNLAGGSGLVLDRDVPAAYRAKYKSMKRKAWKHKQFFAVNTQIIFSGHLMQLRYRDKVESGKKDYTLIEEFYPDPLTMCNFVKGNKARHGMIPSSSINAASLELAKEQLLITGLAEMSELKLDALLKKMLKKQEFDNIKGKQMLNGSARLTFGTKSICSKVLNAYNGKVVEGFKFNFEAFEE